MTRTERFEALRTAIAATPTEVMEDYLAEVRAWDVIEWE